MEQFQSSFLYLKFKPKEIITNDMNQQVYLT